MVDERTKLEEQYVDKASSDHGSRIIEGKKVRESAVHQVCSTATDEVHVARLHVHDHVQSYGIVKPKGVKALTCRVISNESKAKHTATRYRLTDYR